MENETRNPETGREKLGLKEFFSLGEVGNYFFRKKSTSTEKNFSLKMMHGINRFSIIVFLVGMTYFIIKHLF